MFLLESFLSCLGHESPCFATFPASAVVFSVSYARSGLHCTGPSCHYSQVEVLELLARFFLALRGFPIGSPMSFMRSAGAPIGNFPPPPGAG